jgi:hypothetical protein
VGWVEGIGCQVLLILKRLGGGLAGGAARDLKMRDLWAGENWVSCILCSELVVFKRVR